MQNRKQNRDALNPDFPAFQGHNNKIVSNLFADKISVRQSMRSSRKIYVFL